MLPQVGGRSCGFGLLEGGCYLACFYSRSRHRLFAKLSFTGCSFSSNRLVLHGPLGASLGIGGGRHARLLGVAAALEVSTDAVKKKERLSKEERAALVETYVRRHMASHEGQFPTLAAVLRETGGSRNIVREILNGLAGTMKLEDVGVMEDTGLNVSEAESQTEDKDPDLSLKDSSFAELGISTSSNGALVEHRKVAVPKNVIFDDHDLEESIMDGIVDEGLPDMSQSQERSALDTPKPSKEYADERMSLWDRLHANSSTKAKQRNGAYVSESRVASLVPDIATHSRDVADTSDMWSNTEKDSADFASLDYPEGIDSHRYKSSAVKLDSSAEGVADRNRAGPSSKHVMFVRFLHPEATAEDLRAAFQDCGRITRARPVHSRRGLPTKYIYGFVDFDSAEGLKNALKKDVEIRGIRVDVRPSTSKLSLDPPGSPSDAVSARHAISAHGSGSSLVLKSSQGDPVLEEGYPVLLEDVPQEIAFHVQDALAAHGDIISSYSKVQDSGNVSVYISFKTEVAKESALAAHGIHLGGKTYQICRLDNPKTTVVRISNIAAETSEEKIYNTCKLCGSIESVNMRTVGVVDVCFRPNEIRHMIHILDRLNEVNIDKRRWRAQPAPICSQKAFAEICRSVEGRKWLQSQQFQVLGSLETSLKDALMHTEDLRVLLSLEGSNSTLASGSNKLNSLTSLIRDVVKS